MEDKNELFLIDWHSISFLNKKHFFLLHSKFWNFQNIIIVNFKQMANLPTVEEINQIVTNLRNYFNEFKTRPLKWRLQQLDGLVRCLTENEGRWADALQADLGRPSFETRLMISGIIADIKHTSSNLEKWIRPKGLPHAMVVQPGSTHLTPEPYGVVANFIPFNYPMFLGFTTMAPIFAAGNVCLLKPSSNTPASGQLFVELLPKYLDKQAIYVITGPTAICDLILQCRFDFIFYTGSPRIAKGVMAAASKFLTPVLLELGGKSPVYVDKDINLSIVCKRIANGKLFNAGQTCVAPDYVLCHQDIYEKFKPALISAIQEQYPSPEVSPDLAHIINDRHFERLIATIDGSGGQILLNGYRNKDQKYIGPTVVDNPDLNSVLMTDEIFGPVIPIIPIQGVNEAIEFINQREKPLALYVMTSNSKVFQEFEKKTSSGALMNNATTFHVSSPTSPFGGVGNSGMGQYHGKFGFKSLSHLKPVLTNGTWFDLSPRYPPYSESHLKFVRTFA